MFVLPPPAGRVQFRVTFHRMTSPITVSPPVHAKPREMWYRTSEREGERGASIAGQAVRTNRLSGRSIEAESKQNLFQTLPHAGE